MIDSFVLLAPILLLGVVALVRFVGCTFHPASASKADAPAFAPPPGEYTGSQMVTLSASAASATILYTTDGSTPTDPPTGTTQTYSGPITVATSELISALTTAPAFADSDVAPGMYMIDQPIVLQQPLAEKNETTNTITVTTAPFTSAVASQNLIMVWIWYNSLAQTVATVTDTAGNLYARAVGPTAGTGAIAGFQQEIWYAKGVNGGSNFTVTATFSSAPAAAFERSISAHDYAGASPTAPVDVVSAQSLTGNPNPSSGAVATTAARLIFGAAIFPGRGAAGPGFTQESALRNNVTEDQPFAAPGTAEAVFTIINGAADWIAQMVTLK